MVFVIIEEIIHKRTSLSWVFLQVFLKIVTGNKLELMYIFLIGNFKDHSSLWLTVGCAAAISFVFINRKNYLYLRSKSDMLFIIPKGFLKLPDLLLLIKQGSLPLPRNLAFPIFGESQILFLIKENSTTLPFLNCPEILPSASDKVKSIAEIWSDNINLHDSGISLSAFPSMTGTGSAWLGQFDISAVIHMKDPFVKKLLSRSWDCPSLRNWIGALILSLLLKLP